MSEKNSNCCNTDNSDCKTEEINCCSAEQKSFSSKKKIGVGILLIAITFAIISAFNTDKSIEKSSCNSEQKNCTTSCETGNKESSCCSKK